MNIKAIKSKRENINQNVQMYALILSDILLEHQAAPHFQDIREAIIRVNVLIAGHPKTHSYQQLKTELVHLKALAESQRLQAVRV